MCLKRRGMRAASPVVLAVAFLSTLSLASCSDRKDAPAATPSSAAPATPPVSTPPVSTPAPASDAPVVAPGAATDVTKKGTSTGMIGGESGTVASSGKPGTGTDAGAGTGAAESSDTKTSDKK